MKYFRWKDTERPVRRYRHLKSQMKFFGGPRFKKAADNATWKFANQQAIKYRSNGLFGLN